MAREMTSCCSRIISQMNHVVVQMTSSVLPSTLPYDQGKNLIQYWTFESTLVRFQQKIGTIDSQNKEKPVEDDCEGWKILTPRFR